MENRRNSSIYQFSVVDTAGKEVTLSQFQGKVLMIVNTSTKDEWSNQLEQLEVLQKEYQDQGFEVLAFPSDDKFHAEPLSDVEAERHSMLKYATSFAFFSRLKAQGKRASRLFKFLSNKEENGAMSSRPKWNFHKYIVNRDGQLVDTFYGFTDPTSPRVKQSITSLL